MFIIPLKVRKDHVAVVHCPLGTLYEVYFSIFLLTLTNRE